MMDREALCGAMSVLYTGIRWTMLPQGLGFGPGDDVLAAIAGLDRDRSAGPVAGEDAGRARD